jgi:adenylate cyclase
VDFIAVKGAASAIEIYEPLGERGQVSEQVLAFKSSYESGLAAYHARQFEEAVTVFSRLHQEHPGKKCVEILLHRCREAQANPPSEGGDLTFRFQSK